MDWQLKLMQVLNCFGEMEGTVFPDHWAYYGISAEEQRTIEATFDRYYTAQQNEKASSRT